MTSELDGNTLTVSYSLNADATSVKFIIKNVDGTTDTVTLTGKTAGDHSFTYDVSTRFSGGGNLTWEIAVESAVVDTPTPHGTVKNFYRPSSVIIDKNYESPYYGRIYVTEAAPSGKTNSNVYESYKTGAGVYAFDPALNSVLNESGNPGFTGGMTRDASEQYDPRRIRISEDGRVFVSRISPGVSSVFEINPDDLDADFTPIFKFASVSTTNWNLLDASGNFIAAPNCGLDVIGSGENLKLLALSANSTAADFYPFRCDEYNLGTATSWNKAPSKNIAALTNQYSISLTSANVVYDNEGGIWFCQYRATPSDYEPSIVHVNAAGNVDYKAKGIVARNGGIAVSPDGSKLAVAKSSGSVVIYEITKTNGTLGIKLLYDFATATGTTLNDIAWDNANNIYIVNSDGEKLKVFALPRESGTVVTPAAKRYTIEIPVPEKECIAAQDDINTNEYYATFSNNISDMQLIAAAGCEITLYDVNVSGNSLVLNPRQDNKVARGEAVLVKTNHDSFTAAQLTGEESLTPAEYGTATLLLASPSEDQTISCPASEALLYRLAYNNYKEQTGLGFYWGNADGTQINAKSGKGYLKVPATQGAQIKSFRLNPLPTHVEEINAEELDMNEPIYDLS